MKVIFVCTGNTCRSPLAEGLFKKMLSEKGIEGVEVTSAGLAAFAGDEVSANSVEAAKKYGVDISTHKARCLSPYELDDSIFFCMSASHMAALLPYVGKERVFLIGAGISDPYGGNQEIYDKCAEEINIALNGVLKAVISKLISIEPMKKEHIEQIAEIEHLCFSLPWSENALEDELTNENAHFLTAVIEEKVLGYIGIIEICGEGDITNIAVHPDFRRLGIADALLKSAEYDAKQRNSVSITLEVRVSNEAAIALYNTNGYKAQGIRKGFYDRPKEDALIMTKFFTEENKDENTCN